VREIEANLGQIEALIEETNLSAGNWTDLQVLTKCAVMNSASHTANANNAVLYTLLDLAKNDVHATVLRVAEAAGLDRPQVVAALASLDKVGLVDRETVRLTMMGLVVASNLKAPRARRQLTRNAA
jgi:hypothetical protein